MSREVLTRARAALDRRRPPLARTIPYCPHSPTERQRQFLELDSLEALYGGQAGGGKSDALIMGGLQFVDVPGYAATLLRRTFADLSLPGALMDRTRAWLSGTVATWDDRGKRWTFPSGASLGFGYCETDGDVYRYQGAEYQYIGIDELTQWTERAYRYLLSRLRRLVGSDVPLRMRGATNPGGVGHPWVLKRYIRPGDPSRPFVAAGLDDNPHLDRDAYRLSLSQLDEETRDQLERGLWVQDARGRIYRYDRTRNSAESLPREHGWRIVVGLDLGASEREETTAFVICAVHPHESCVYVLRSWAVAGMSPTDCADAVTAILDEYGSARVVMDEGALGAAYGREMRRRHNLPVVPAEKRGKLGFRRLLNGAMERGDVRLIVGANDALETELENIVWDKHGLDIAPGMADHLSDALLYAWRDTRSDLATGAPGALPEPGSSAWHVARNQESEDRAYSVRSAQVAREAAAPWERW